MALLGWRGASERLRILMRDLLIGLGYFLTTAWCMVYGVCLVFNPRRFSTLISRPVFGRRSTEQIQDWTQNDNRYWRKIGVVTAAGGAFMFFRPLLSSLMVAKDGSSATIAPQLHDATSAGWVSYGVWLLFLCLGISLVARPSKVLNYFSRHQKIQITSTSLMAPRIVGGVVILIALLGLFQVASQ